MLCVPRVNSTEVHEKPVLIVKQESIPVGFLPPACQLYVIPLDVSSWGKGTCPPSTYPPLEGTWDQRYPPTLVDKQTPVKTLPSLAGCNEAKSAQTTEANSIALFI